jgi:ATP-dependent Lon protease
LLDDNNANQEDFISIPSDEERLGDGNKPKKINFYPNQLFVLPLNKRPFFPGMAAPVFIEKGTFYEILKIVAKTSHKCLALFLTKKEEADIYKLEPGDLYDVGVVARILRIIPIENGGAQVVLSMEQRISVEEFMKGKYLSAKVKYHEDPPVHELSKEVKAYSISIISTIKELLKLNPLFKEELQIFLSHSDFTDPGRLADFAVALTTAARDELQEVLSCFDMQKRIDKALIILKKELDLSKLQSSINQRIESTISKSQREFFLKEQLKAIKKELGLEKDDKTCDIEKFNERLSKRKLTNQVKKVIDEEKEKLSSLEIHSPEYGVCRNYLDWLTIVPWGIYSYENHDLSKAEKILEQDHYGLKDIKERIIQFIGVGKLTGGVKGSIICLVGPPGVGKTSVGKSIARALNREFYRFSVGGMRDEAEIKGHRRTYVGAMPGKMIQALKQTQTMNPVIMIDEVDKMGASYQGDPASALLEVLDPEQNKEFNDHYLDVPTDLSNILFIVTANVLDTIPEPLKDRMEIMRLSGYIQKEKIEIAKKYLIPKGRKQTGLLSTDILLKKDAIAEIIEGYARESGVRSLENNIKKIMRQVALKKAKEKEKGKKLEKQIIEKSNIKEYLKKPIFISEVYYEKMPIGVVTGLAWTALGGVTIYIETSKSFSEKTQMKLTGQAGDVMKESSQIAWSFLASQKDKYAPNKSFFEKSIVHMHIPEGATPKDGPSAGITMVTALLSLLKEQSVKDSIAMTGEITLTGKVLTIGGLKEKLIAARRAKIKTLIFPKGNIRDYDELPKYLKEGLSVYFVEHYDEVFKIAFEKNGQTKTKTARKDSRSKATEKKGRVFKKRK